VDQQLCGIAQDLVPNPQSRTSRRLCRSSARNRAILIQSSERLGQLGVNKNSAVIFLQSNSRCRTVIRQPGSATTTVYIN
jgi:hypothetical protein